MLLLAATWGSISNRRIIAGTAADDVLECVAILCSSLLQLLHLTQVLKGLHAADDPARGVIAENGCGDADGDTLAVDD